MKKFENPAIQVEEFEVMDVITASSTNSTLPGGDIWDTGKEPVS